MIAYELSRRIQHCRCISNIFRLQMEVILLVMGSLKLCTTSQSFWWCKHPKNGTAMCQSIHFSTHLPLNWWIWRVNGCCNEWQILSSAFFSAVAFNFAMNIHSLSGLEVAALKNVRFVPIPKQVKAKIGCSSWIISLKREVNLLWCTIFRMRYDWCWKCTVHSKCAKHGSTRMTSINADFAYCECRKRNSFYGCPKKVIDENGIRDQFKL